jgi:hypothetical protein
MGRVVRRSRVQALLSLWTIAMTSTLGIVDVTHGGPNDDALCALTAVFQHDPANHRIEPASSGRPDPEHCFICHWARSLTPSTARHRLLKPAKDGDAFATRLVAMAPAGDPDRKLPARAPPV